METLHSSAERAWRLAERQHGVVSRAQLLRLGFSHGAIDHRLASGRLHRTWRGVYAVGRPQLTRRGRWLAAVLSCGDGSALSHHSAAALWGIRAERPGRIDVSVPARAFRSRPGIAVHRRESLGDEVVAVHEGIPVTRPAWTLVDIALDLSPGALEAAINEADRSGLASPEELRAAVEPRDRRRGAARLREVLDRRTFTLTDSELERRFLRLVRDAGLPLPRTQVELNGFRVDFHWPELGLVVETDGLRYHRTPAQQARDRVRDQAHVRAGLTVLRFTHAQVRYEPGYVRATLAATVRRLQASRQGG